MANIIKGSQLIALVSRCRPPLLFHGGVVKVIDQAALGRFHLRIPLAQAWYCTAKSKDESLSVNQTQEIPPKKDPPQDDKIFLKHPYRPTNFDKKVLVWTKRFKTVDEIPEVISFSTMDRSRNKFRIKFANIMILLTALACVGMIISGKRAQSRGESVQQQNLDWHRDIKAGRA